MFGNFARWNEPSRDLGKKVDYSLRVSPTSLAASQKMMPILGESVSSSARLHIQVLHILQGGQRHPIGVFPIKIKTEISLLISYSFAIFIV